MKDVKRKACNEKREKYQEFLNVFVFQHLTPFISRFSFHFSRLPFYTSLAFRCTPFRRHMNNSGG